MNVTLAPQPSGIRIDNAAPYTMTIGGKAVTSATSFEVRNPATNEVLALAPEATHAQLKEAIAAAQAAFPA